jgi:hypothetical protein
MGRRGRSHSWSGHCEEEISLSSLLEIELTVMHAIAQSLYFVHYLHLAENSKFETFTSPLYMLCGRLL